MVFSSTSTEKTKPFDGCAFEFSNDLTYADDPVVAFIVVFDYMACFSTFMLEAKFDQRDGGNSTKDLGLSRYLQEAQLVFGARGCGKFTMHWLYYYELGTSSRKFWRGWDLNALRGKTNIAGVRCVDG